MIKHFDGNRTKYNNIFISLKQFNIGQNVNKLLNMTLQDEKYHSFQSNPFKN